MPDIHTLIQTYPAFPKDITFQLPLHSQLPREDQHFLISIPWEEKYLNHIPVEYRAFFQEVLPHLSQRTTNVHIAICLGYLDAYVAAATAQGHRVRRDCLAYSLILHDIGWSQLSEFEIAASLGVTGLALTEKAIAPKEKHAIIGEKMAREILTKHQNTLRITSDDIELICKAVRYHDQPEVVAGAQSPMPIEVQLLVDLDHLWSFTQHNFWQDTLRKNILPENYLANLKNDLDSYFVSDIGKQKARELLAEREREVRST